MAFPSPNGPLEVVFSFDTTGSMYNSLEQIRGRINDLIQRLQCDIPGIRTAVFAHGDYCDAASTYVTKWIDFTTNVAELCDFVSNVEGTRGNSPECYELVLHQTRTKLSWTPCSRRVLVMIGDDEPHGPDYAANTDKIDWKNETKELALMGVTIYPVQCGNRSPQVTAFYKTLAAVTSGKYLKLGDFNNLFHVLMAVCYREGNDMGMLASYEKEVRAKCGAVPTGRYIDALFASLRADDARVSSASSDTITASTTRATTVSTLKKTSSVVSLKPRSVKTLHTKTPLKSPSRRKSYATKGKTSTKNASLVDRYRQMKLPLLKRENVPETNFGLRSLTWSPWTLVLSPEIPQGSEDNWEARGRMTGYRLKYIKSNKPQPNKSMKVLFEVSVQTPGSGRQRHVVYSSFSTRCLQNKQWEACLLRRVRHQLDKLLSDGCKIFLRFHLVSVREYLPTLRKHLKRYDYAWKPIPSVRNEARTATKGAHDISMDLS